MLSQTTTAANPDGVATAAATSATTTTSGRRRVCVVDDNDDDYESDVDSETVFADARSHWDPEQERDADADETGADTDFEDDSVQYISSRTRRKRTRRE
jgi:hypothetical protein